MPWTVNDVKKHNKNIPDRWKSLWVQVANDALRRCEKAGEANCDASAIKQANARVAERMNEVVDNLRSVKSAKKDNVINIIEETDVPFADAKIRPENNYIEGVAILGHTSKNKRKYPDYSMRQAANMLEGAPAYANHPKKGEENVPRDVRELIGRYYEVKYDTALNKVMGDLEVLRHQGWVFDIAKQMPKSVGLSINAQGKVRRDKDGWEIVEQFTNIFSADLVSEPATNTSLFEETEMNYEKLTIEDLENNCPELIQELKEQFFSENNKEENNMSEELIKKLEKEADELKEALKVKEDEVNKFKEDADKQLKEKDTKIDELETEKKLKEEAKAREELIATKLEKAKLDEGLITERFKKNLKEAKDEKEIDELIEDRKLLLPKSKTESKEKEEKETDFMEENVDTVFGLPKKEKEDK